MSDHVTDAIRERVNEAAHVDTTLDLGALCYLAEAEALEHWLAIHDPLMRPMFLLGNRTITN